MAIDITSILGGSLGGVIKDIIGQFKLDPNTKAQLEAQLDESKDALLSKQMEMEAALQESAGQNIRTEEASGDKYTARARPTLMYVVEFILFVNYVGGWAFKKWGLGPIDLPTPILWLFGSVCLGYTGARSWDKFISAPGDSSFNVSTILGSVAGGNKS